MMPETPRAEPTPSVDEPIRLTAFDPRWIESAAKEAATLRHRLDGFNVEIEHIGSTAVEGMRAKPILDLMAGLRRPDDIEQIVDIVSHAGWTDLGEAGVPGRRYLRRRDRLALNLHLVALDSPHWRGALALRDYLRAHADERKAYSNAKARAVSAGRTWLLAYSEAKARHVAALVERALAWAQRDNESADRR
jgi:GrpB-like predicted nucleotidyltransferase (UPF0157 family)